jgi:hypothetical protein
MLTRETLGQALASALEPQAWCDALWEGGSAAFGRADEHSDLDVQVAVAAGHEAEAFTVVEAALAAIAPIRRSYELPQPTSHGAQQRFYQLTGAPDSLMVDLCVIARGTSWTFTERELHGEPVVYFDKTGAVKVTSLDPAAQRELLAKKLATLSATFPMFQVLTLKELARGQELDALHYYLGTTLRPLTELLRIRYCPTRIIFGARYAAVDLPRAVYERLRAMYFVADADDLRAKHAVAGAWFAEVLAEVDARGLPSIEQT